MGALDSILIPSLRLEEILSDGSTLTNPAADSRRLFLGEDGYLHLRDSAGTITDPVAAGAGIPATIFDAKGDLIGASAADTAARLAVGADGTGLVADAAQTTGLRWVNKQFAFARRTAGSYTPNSTTWADLDNGLDLVLPAATADIVEVGLSGLWSSTGANVGCLTIVSVVAASPVNDLATGAAPDNTTQGVGGWVGVASVTSPIGGSIFYTLQAGDISGGTVTLRIRYRTSTASNKSLTGTATNPLHWFARNHGPDI